MFGDGHVDLIGRQMRGDSVGKKMVFRQYGYECGPVIARDARTPYRRDGICKATYGYGYAF